MDIIGFYRTLFLQRDNTRELLQKTGREEEIENELLDLTECECHMNVYDPTKCRCRAREAHFLLAQFYYDTEQYDKAWRWYSKIQQADLRGTPFFSNASSNLLFRFSSRSTVSTCSDVFRKNRTERLHTGLILFHDTHTSNCLLIFVGNSLPNTCGYHIQRERST